MLLYKNYVTKKEASTHFQSEEITQSKTRFSDIRNEQPFLVRRPYSAQNPFLEYETSYPIEP